MDLAAELRDKSDLPADRVAAIEEEITVKSAAIDDLLAEKRQSELESKIAEMDDRLKSFTITAARANAQSKAAAIMAGASNTVQAVKSVGRYSETNFLSALTERLKGDP